MNQYLNDHICILALTNFYWLRNHTCLSKFIFPFFVSSLARVVQSTLWRASVWTCLGTILMNEWKEGWTSYDKFLNYPTDFLPMPSFTVVKLVWLPFFVDATILRVKCFPFCFFFSVPWIWKVFPYNFVSWYYNAKR